MSAGGDQVGWLVAPAVRLANQMVQADVRGSCIPQISQAVQAAEIVPQVDSQPQIFPDLSPAIRLVSAGFHFRFRVSFSRFVSFRPCHYPNYT